MHLQRADELGASDVAIVGEDLVVALALVEHAERGRERMGARRDHARPVAYQLDQPPTAARQLRDRVFDVMRRRADDLQLRRRQLELEARVVDAVEDLLRDAGEVQRRRVDEHDFLLEADGERFGRVEDRAQRVLGQWSASAGRSDDVSPSQASIR